MKAINLSVPLLGKEEEKCVLEVLRSGNLAQGVRVEQFEKMFAKMVGTKYAVAVTNGSIALQLALLALGIKKSDEVITSPFTFIASVNAIRLIGAVPVFVDIDYNTFNIDPQFIEKKITAKTKAILPVHLYGLPADMLKITEIAKRHKLFVIEDACQAHGAAIKEKKVGSWGDVGCFSFYPTKNMTTGEGGMITTNNKIIAEKIRLLRNHGMQERYSYDSFGFNYRMTEISAAIGLEQLKKLSRFNKMRVANAQTLIERLPQYKEVVLPRIPSGYTHVFHQFTIKIPNSGRIKRQAFINHMKQRKITTGIYYPIPVHKTKVYSDLNYRLPVAEQVAQEVVSLPVNPSLKPNDLKRIIDAVTSIFS